MTQPAQHAWIGKVLGNYVLTSFLGEGGMGSVFAAEHRFLGDRVAVKVLHGSFAAQKSIALRFFQEAKATREIAHPNIVKIVDFGQGDDGGLYLVMELLEGSTLTALVAEGPLDEATAARIATQTADGLDAAHQKGIVHRDLKPDNILVVGAMVKILDFGVAKIANAAQTATGTVLGTPRYMAPEQARGAKEVGPPADIYSLGVILYKMVTGRTPFTGTATEMITAALFDPPPPPSQFAPVSRDMEALILHCLEKEPMMRPASMREVRERLSPLLTAHGAGDATIFELAPPGLEIPELSAVMEASVAAPAAREASTMKDATPHGTISQSIGEVSVRLPGPLSASMEAVPRPRRALAAALAAVALGAVIAAGLVFLRRDQTPSPPTGAASNVALPPASAPTTAMPVAAPPSAVSPAPSAASPAVATATAVPRARVSIQTIPAGAHIVVDGHRLGAAPAILEVRLPQEIALELDGYQTVRQIITSPGDLTVRLTRARPATRGAPPRAANSKGKKTISGESLD